MYFHFYKLHMIIWFFSCWQIWAAVVTGLLFKRIWYLLLSSGCAGAEVVLYVRLLIHTFGTDVSLTEGCLSTTTPPPQHCSNLSVCLCRKTLPDSAAAFLPITKKVLESQPNVSLHQDRLSAVGGGAGWKGIFERNKNMSVILIVESSCQEKN